MKRRARTRKPSFIRRMKQRASGLVPLSLRKSATWRIQLGNRVLKARMQLARFIAPKSAW